MKAIKWTGVILIVLTLIYISGAHPAHLVVNTIPVSFPAIPLQKLEQKIIEEERQIKELKTGNEAKIIWFDSIHKTKTAYAIVYLHGFSASQAEGYPVHHNLAVRYGCNLFLSRLYAHGLKEEEPLLSLTAEKLITSAKEAIAVGKQIGEKVIVMSTSTGGTLSLLLAGADPDIAGLILYSPNVDVYDSKSFLLTQPWGLQLARTVIGSKYYTFHAPDAAQQYWNTKYRIEALIELKRLLNASMNKHTFQTIHQPVFMGYYYKDKLHQDDVVSIPRMLDMYDQLGTEPALKRKAAFPDAGFHVIASSYWTKNTLAVQEETAAFLEQVMKLIPVKSNTLCP
ncbi:MAG: Pimeloyl-ACP methyl ester carboxylesterase [Chitinophagaceae bacterium]|nr:Pimeloyl-ACP methyl ester carboxylesterase [Chitinophagaceae bacterium]